MKRYYSHGKLLLTGEYLVLDGALSLAIPTKFGQELKVEETSSGTLNWTSLDENEQVWFEAEYDLVDKSIICIRNSNEAISDRLQQVLNTAKSLNSKFLSIGYKVSTQLEFPKNWGLGTSSTLINNIANWANIDPYLLLEQTFGGSGYDIACANAMEAITYQIKQDGQNRKIETVDFDPSFKNNLYFVYLNQKKNSRDGIAQYRTNTSDLKEDIRLINQITKAYIHCNSLDEFQSLIDLHEKIISKIISQKPIKEELFKDFSGSLKSLGAWGGDFVLVASKDNPSSYFQSKGFSTILEYNQMIYK